MHALLDHAISLLRTGSENFRLSHWSFHAFGWSTMFTAGEAGGGCTGLQVCKLREAQALATQSANFTVKSVQQQQGSPEVRRSRRQAGQAVLHVHMAAHEPSFTLRAAA